MHEQMNAGGLLKQLLSQLPSFTDKGECSTDLKWQFYTLMDKLSKLNFNKQIDPKSAFQNVGKYIKQYIEHENKKELEFESMFNSIV